MVPLPHAVCPFIDTRQTRCAGRLTLPNLSSAFELCAGQYDRCPIYVEIRIERIHDRCEACDESAP